MMPDGDPRPDPNSDNDEELPPHFNDPSFYIEGEEDDDED